MKKEILYKVRTLVSGDIFGHEEFIMHDKQDDPTIKRWFRVKSLVHSELIYIK